MAQAFITTYRNNFRWNSQDRVLPILPNQNVPDCDTDGDLWLVVNDNVDAEGSENLAKVESAVKQMQLKRMKSTYKKDYCKDLSKKQPLSPSAIEQESYENELLESCKLLYERKRERILPVLDSSRRVNGYIRPARLYTPLTRYQYDIGKVGYDILNES